MRALGVIFKYCNVGVDYRREIAAVNRTFYALNVIFNLKQNINVLKRQFFWFNKGSIPFHCYKLGRIVNKEKTYSSFYLYWKPFAKDRVPNSSGSCRFRNSSGFDRFRKASRSNLFCDGSGSDRFRNSSGSVRFRRSSGSDLFRNSSDPDLFCEEQLSCWRLLFAYIIKDGEDSIASVWCWFIFFVRGKSECQFSYLKHRMYGVLPISISGLLAWNPGEVLGVEFGWFKYAYCPFYS